MICGLTLYNEVSTPGKKWYCNQAHAKSGMVTGSECGISGGDVEDQGRPILIRGRNRKMLLSRQSLHKALNQLPTSWALAMCQV